jgi:hypothetical protein
MSNPSLQAYQQAELSAAREDARRGFIVHLLVTVLVSAALVVVNVLVAPEFPWSIFPIVGMSVGVYAHWHFGVAHVDDTVHQHQEEMERRAA